MKAKVFLGLWTYSTTCGIMHYHRIYMVITLINNHHYRCYFVFFLNYIIIIIIILLWQSYFVQTSVDECTADGGREQCCTCAHLFCLFFFFLSLNFNSYSIYFSSFIKCLCWLAWLNLVHFVRNRPLDEETEIGSTFVFNAKIYLSPQYVIFLYSAKLSSLAQVSITSFILLFQMFISKQSKQI